MANEIEKAGNGVPAVAREMSPAEMFASLVDLAKDPSVDPQKMTALVDLQMKMMDYSKQEEFNKAKIAAIMEMPAIGKRGEIKNKGVVQSRYSRFEDIYRIVKPILQRHGLAISFNVGNSDKMVTVQPLLSHTNGHVEKGEFMSLPIDTSGAKNSTQGAGSASQYGKRYTMKAMLNIVDEGVDDDGRGAGGGDPLYEEAKAAASCGLAAYARWYKEDIDTAKRAKLVANGWHDEFKAIAERADATAEKDDEFPGDTR